MTRRRNGNTTERGYGAEHQAERRRWAPRVATGQVSCWRCGKLIAPGTPWDLGHDDHDRSRYRGPEHRSCNRGAAARKVNATRGRGTTTAALCPVCRRPLAEGDHESTRW